MLPLMYTKVPLHNDSIFCGYWGFILGFYTIFVLNSCPIINFFSFSSYTKSTMIPNVKSSWMICFHLCKRGVSTESYTTIFQTYIYPYNFESIYQLFSFIVDYVVVVKRLNFNISAYSRNNHEIKCACEISLKFFNPLKDQ